MNTLECFKFHKQSLTSSICSKNPLLAYDLHKIKCTCYVSNWVSWGKYTRVYPSVWFLTPSRLVTIVWSNHMYLPIGFNLIFILLEFRFIHNTLNSFTFFILHFESVFNFLFSEIQSLVCCTYNCGVEICHSAH